MSDEKFASRLKTLRDELDRVDAELIDRAARRQRLVAEIGRLKHARGRQLRDFRREREVLKHVRTRAGASGLDPGLAEALLKSLIEASLTRQEQDRVRLSARGADRRALVIGGGGRMGRWLVRFLDTQGYAVGIADPAGGPAGVPSVADFRDADLDADLIVISAPLKATPGILDGLAARSVPGLVLEIGSLKSPLLESLRHAVAAGLRICSVHPMFGPDTRVLAGRHVLLMDVGDPRAVRQARALFADTMAECVELPLEEHDRLMALVLGLSHALNIAFFTTLTRSGVPAGQLAALSSTTFMRQLDIARDVAVENPALYFEIQHLNDHRNLALEGLKDAVETLVGHVEQGDEAGFAALMEAGATYLHSHREAAESDND